MNYIFIPKGLFFSLLFIVLPTLTGCNKSPGTDSQPTTTRQISAATNSVEIPAFEGAEGFGASSQGGRGGRVIEVTNLKDSGPGSLREAVEASGPRIVVFKVGGIIDVENWIVATDPYLTIAGQTAPGGGITLRNASGNKHSPLAIRTHDVVVRYITVRPGTGNVEGTSTLRGIEINTGAHHVIIDHCSISWAVDGNIEMWSGVHDITVQWSIMAEGLYNSTHAKGPHSKGTLVGDNNSYNISMHHNLFAHNDDRNPRIKIGGMADIVNNVVYNPGKGKTHVSNLSRVNFIGNMYIEGVNTEQTSSYVLGDSKVLMYFKGNISTLRTSNGGSETFGMIRDGDLPLVVSKPFDVPAVTATDAFTAYEDVLDRAGNSSSLDEAGRFLQRRDSVDKSITRDVLNRSGRIIDKPSEVGGWPNIENGPASKDSDHDGMPDTWEKANGLNAGDPDDGSRITGSGYTNLELYLNGRAVKNLNPPPPEIDPPSDNPDTPLDVANLVAHWDFKEGSGTIAHDSSPFGSDNSATLSGDFSWFSGGVKFINTDGRIEVPNSSDINTAEYSKRTIAIRFKVFDVGIKSRKQVLYEEGGGAKGMNLFVYDGQLYVGIWSSQRGGMSTYLSTNQVVSRQWAQVVVVLDAKETLQENAFRAYFNGKSFGSGPAMSLPAHGGGIGIGSVNGSTSFFDGSLGDLGDSLSGKLGDVRIYNRVLSEEEIRALSGG